MLARGHTETAGGAHADESATPGSHRNRSAGRRRVGPRTRKLLFWEEGNDQPHVLILRAGDVYISSPVANEHQVLHDDDPASGEELLEFGGMGPVKLAIQLRCDTFALNRGRSPPASPKAALEAASEAVLRWLLEIPLALPTLGEARTELV